MRTKVTDTNTQQTHTETDKPIAIGKNLADLPKIHSVNIEIIALKVLVPTKYQLRLHWRMPTFAYAYIGVCLHWRMPTLAYAYIGVCLHWRMYGNSGKLYSSTHENYGYHYCNINNIGESKHIFLELFPLTN